MSSPLSSSYSPLWLREEDVRATISLNEAIDSLAEGLPLEAEGGAANVPKALGTWDNSSLHSLGAAMPARGYAGFKTWINTPQGAMAVFSLFDTAHGSLLALIEAAALGTMRTAGISGLATRVLTDPETDEMTLLGTGGQAFMQIAAIAAVRPLKKVRVFSPNVERRTAFAVRAEGLLNFEVKACESVEQAVEGSPLITLVTRADQPFLKSAAVAQGAHINAAGAILPGKAEFTQDIFDRADIVLVDNVENARQNSREFREHFGSEDGAWNDVQTLGQWLLSGKKRSSETDVSLFKPMGMGLSDLAVAITVFERAVERQLGTGLQLGTRAAPRWEPLKSVA